MTDFLIRLALSLALSFETEILQEEASSSIPHAISALFGEDQMNLPVVLSVRRLYNWFTRFVANCLSAEL